MDFEAEYLAFIAAARARNVGFGLKLEKTKRRIRVSGENHLAYQVHHVKPRHCGGSNTLDNAVALNSNEHVTAHFLYNLIVVQRVYKNQKRLKKDDYGFGLTQLQSIIKFIPNIMQSLLVTYHFKRKGVKDCIIAPLGDVAKFMCVLKNKSAADPISYLVEAAKIINACFSDTHKLCCGAWNGKAKFTDLNFAA